MLCTLVLGYGNLDRSDDGVAYYVVNNLRRRLGQPALAEDESGLEALGGSIDAVFLTQLTPDLVNILTAYDQVIFVDAHVYPQAPNLCCRPVQPEAAQQALTHHMTPQLLLALLHGLHSRAPAGHIVSIRGHEFGFGRRLSSSTSKLVEAAVEKALSLAQPSAG
jgi:hydrogenase maturation protease